MVVESHLPLNPQVENHQPLNPHMESQAKVMELHQENQVLLIQLVMDMDTEKDQHLLDTDMDMDLHLLDMDMDTDTDMDPLLDMLDMPRVDMEREAQATESRIRINTTTMKETTNPHMLLMPAIPQPKTLTSESTF